MLSILKSHPLPIAARFDYGISLTYAFPPEVLIPLLRPGLELDTYGDRGFLSVVAIHTRELRPAFLPKIFWTEFLPDKLPPVYAYQIEKWRTPARATDAEK
jgi:hypothetical protein